MYRVVQPIGRLRWESRLVSEHVSVAAAYAEIDRMAEQMVRTGAPSNAIELFVVDQEWRRVRRPNAH